MKKYHVGFRGQLILSFCVFLLALNLLIGYAMIEHAKSALKQQIQERMLDITNTAASVIDGDMYEKITDSNAHSPEYRHVLSVLTSFASHSTLEYVYGLRQVGDKDFVFTIDPSLSNGAEFGESAVATDALQKAAAGIPSVCDEPYTDSYGRFYTAYSPIYNSYGNIVGVVAADCDAEWYADQMRYIAFIILCSCLVSMLLGAGIVFVFTNQLRKRFRRLNTEMHELAEDVNDFTQKVTGAVVSAGTRDGEEPHPAVEDKAESILLMEKRSYDEIHELGNQILHMRHDLQEHINKVYSLAFRDPLTGVKSKQAYVEYEHMMNHMIANGSVSPFSVAVFDVNGLKIVNDTLGHKAGDELIRNACGLICDAFSHSPVFRIGGDEFVAVLKGKDYEMRYDIFVAFLDKMRTHAATGKVVVAGGLSDYVAEDHMFQDAFERADSLMYENKKQLKAVAAEQGVRDGA